MDERGSLVTIPNVCSFKTLLFCENLRGLGPVRKFFANIRPVQAESNVFDRPMGPLRPSA